MIAIDNKNLPFCKCHNLPMVFAGNWRCKIKRKENHKRDNNSIKAYIRKRKWELKKSKEFNLNKLEELNARSAI